MSKELTMAAQQALEALKNARHGRVLEGKSIDDAIYTLSQALTQRPAAQTERDTGPRVLREVFAVCEDTMDKMAAESTEFSRVRAFEAKGISRAIGTWFQDEYCGRSHMGEPSLPAPQQATPEPRKDEARRLIDTLRNDARGGRAATVHDLDAAANLIEASLSATPEPLTLGPLAKRNIYDAIRGAYDLGYNDARNARTVPGDSAPGYDGRSVEEDHGGALFNTLNRRLAATPEPVGEVVAWQRRDRNIVTGEWSEWHEDDDIEEELDPEWAERRPLFTRPAPGVPDGWKLVPVEPPRAMMEAGEALPPIVDSDMRLRRLGWSLMACQNRRRYLAMLAATPQAPAPALDAGVVRDAERWRKFVSLDYKVRREWAANLSLTPVLTEWVDALPAIVAAMSAQAGGGK